MAAIQASKQDKPTLTVVPADKDARNPIRPFDPDLVDLCRANLSAIERRAASLPKRRTVKKDWQAAWLLKAIACTDLTTLSGDDTPGRVARLCAKARHPLREDLVHALGIEALALRVGAVCVYPTMVGAAVRALEGSGIPVASVATAFPAGLSTMATRLADIKAAVEAGAQEIDIVVTRAHVLTGNWRALYEEVAQCREACGAAHMKTILATGELGTLRNVARASMVAMMAGSDFIKTSTGKEDVNAILPVGLVMTRAIRQYKELTGHDVGFKPAGGIRSAKQALDWLILMREELGRAWQEPTLFRLGASTLLSDIERQLDHYATGRYAAYNHQPLV
ncbi:MAG TPA: deoxyribose-phosphate aldolase [Dongiaceae bacterium]|nr:deoxyribose-phosphate aldolase [Dongiaceae bacterium]